MGQDEVPGSDAGRLDAAQGAGGSVGGKRAGSHDQAGLDDVEPKEPGQEYRDQADAGVFDLSGHRKGRRSALSLPIDAVDSRSDQRGRLVALTRSFIARPVRLR